MCVCVLWHVFHLLRDGWWLKRPTVAEESERMMIEEIKRMDDLAERVMQTETDYDEDGRDGHCSEC